MSVCEYGRRSSSVYSEPLAIDPVGPTVIENQFTGGCHHLEDLSFAEPVEESGIVEYRTELLLRRIDFIQIGIIDLMRCIIIDHSAADTEIKVIVRQQTRFGGLQFLSGIGIIFVKSGPCTHIDGIIHDCRCTRES